MKKRLSNEKLKKKKFLKFKKTDLRNSNRNYFESLTQLCESHQNLKKTRFIQLALLMLLKISQDLMSKSILCLVLKRHMKFKMVSTVKFQQLRNKLTQSSLFMKIQNLITLKCKIKIRLMISSQLILEESASSKITDRLL